MSERMRLRLMHTW